MNEQKKLFPDVKKGVNLVYNSLTLDEAKELAKKICFTEHCFEELQVVGSIRRQKPIVRDIDFVVISNEWQNLGKQLIAKLDALETMKGDKIKRFLVPTDKGAVQADFYRTTPKTWGVYMLIRTGSAEHNVWLAKLALKNHMQLRYSVGLVELPKGNVIASDCEEDIFRSLGLDYINPTQREMIGTIPAWMVKK